MQAPLGLVQQYSQLVPSDTYKVQTAMLASLDEGVRNITKALQQRGMLNEALFIVIADNGPNCRCCLSAAAAAIAAAVAATATGWLMLLLVLNLHIGVADRWAAGSFVQLPPPWREAYPLGRWPERRSFRLEPIV